MEGFLEWGYPNSWMVYNGKSDQWFGGTPILGNLYFGDSYFGI